MDKKTPCSGRVYAPGQFRSQPCSRGASMFHAGKGYCGMHDPIKKAARDKLASEKWDSEYNTRMRKFNEDKHKIEMFNDMLRELKICQQIFAERSYHLDANPQGIQDLLGSTIRKAEDGLTK